MLKFGGNLLGLRGLSEKSLLAGTSFVKLQACGINFFYPREPLDTSEWPENRRLRQLPKQPIYNIKTPKMTKMIKLMRGPEPIHTQLIYKGYGIKALLGGRMKYQHFEAVRNKINRKLDTDRMFAIWRIDAPWQPLSKKSSGKTLGGGKGSIHHYCTPVKADRIIVELGGDIFQLEALKILSGVIESLPFPCRVVSQKDLENEKASEEWVQKNNKNPYTMEYVIRNNMGGCHNFLSKYDHEWFGKYK